MIVCEAPLFVAPLDTSGWVQLNVALSQGSGSLRDAAWPLFDDLERWLAAARGRGAIELWFVRKTPALRLRLRGPGLDAQAREELASLLTAHQAPGPVQRWGFATYEPEIHRLGGPVALELVHGLLSRSTDVWLAWERLSRTGRTRLGPEPMVLALYGDLLLRSLQAPEEAWDVWMTLRRIYDGAAGSPPRAPSSPRRPGLQVLATLASPEERALLERGRAAADAFAEGLAHAHDCCLLEGGRRALLGTLASFFFNLWCLRPESIAALCRVAVLELDPRLEITERASEEPAA
jgi:thiopeptide-type bacteriocin biosynthesis protein